MWASSPHFKFKMKTSQSIAETIMEEILNEMEEVLSTSIMTIEDARKILDSGYKLLNKCEELRISRDNWNNKYKSLQSKLNKHTL